MPRLAHPLLVLGLALGALACLAHAFEARPVSAQIAAPASRFVPAEAFLRPDILARALPRRAAAQGGGWAVRFDSSDDGGEEGDDDGPDPQDTARWMLGSLAYGGGAVGSVLLTRHLLPPDTTRAEDETDWRFGAYLLAGHTGGSVATGLAIHLLNGSGGNLLLTTGAAFGLPVAILLGSAAVGSLLSVMGLKPVGTAIGMTGAFVGFTGAPFLASYAAMSADAHVRGDPL
jgi:hypothetical protein